MMNNLVRKIKKAPWVLGQPLTKLPKDNKTVISDLFIWRHNQDWQTFFELMDIASLLGETGKHTVNIIFFDDKGNLFYTKELILKPNQRQTLNISDILIQSKKSLVAFGTFAIFHQQIPRIVDQLNTFIADRGYLSYQYKKAPLRTYVHGNFDAISANGESLSLLGGRSFLNRQYRLQYLFLPTTHYEIVLVNICHSDQKIIVKIIDTITGNTIKNIKSSLQSKATIILLMPVISSPYRIIITSKMIMARPVVFVKSNDKINVFHG